MFPSQKLVAISKEVWFAHRCRQGEVDARPPREPREGNDDGQAPEFAPAFLTGDKED